jgi:hypothetical protein
MTQFEINLKNETFTKLLQNTNVENKRHSEKLAGNLFYLIMIIIMICYLIIFY